jgi:hypothetical protein
MGSSHILDQLDTCFDDTHAVANAGLLLPATLAERLGIEQAADQVIDLGERAGAYRPGRKLLTLVHAMLAGGDCIDDADLLRCGQTASVLGHRAMAPSTLGTFLRSFTFGHVRQLDRLTEQVLARAWAAGAGPGDGPMTMDLDSTVCEVHGYHKQGAAYGYTHTLGYHPLVATRADSGEVLHARQRSGRANTARGAARFVDELAGRVRRAGASGELTMRMDSGFWSAKTIKTCRRHKIRFSITVRQTKPIRAVIATIAADAWVDIVYPDGGVAQVAETRYQGERLIVRRTRLVGAQAELFPNWRYHAFVTDPAGHRGVAGPRSPPPRHGGVVHPRPQRRGRPAASSLGEVCRQRRLARDRHAGAQPAALDRPDRVDHVPAHPQPCSNRPRKRSKQPGIRASVDPGLEDIPERLAA